MHLKPSISFDEPPAAVSKFLNLAVHRPLNRYESSENLLDDESGRIKGMFKIHYSTGRFIPKK